MVDGFHSFSWNEPGKTIQSFFGAGYVFPFDTTGSKSLTLKNDFAFNRVANNGSFLRPMVVYKWQWQPRHTFYIVSWLFLDTRREPLQPLNGGTIYLANTYSLPFKKITFRDELRILFVTINNLRDVVGAVNQLKISINRNKFYAVSNLGFSFYRSDGLTQWIWNIGIGKSF
ncbi:MAG: hypothetical protein UZ12_BCD005003096 [Bacteroidetes bacterium OLB12]|nr:MAG: hypothetical protein UZ12_BCD005003096 [Bacteroidetes bacterium OLB12]